MVYRVVSTKLTEEEHTKFLDACNREGCTPSALIKDSIMKRINTEEKPVEREPTALEKLARELNIKKQEEKELSTDELRRYLRVKK